MKKKQKKRKKMKKMGVLICLIQGILTLIFSIALLRLNLLPIVYSLLIILALAVLWFLPFMNQMTYKRYGTAGKIMSVCISILLFLGGSYLFKTQGMVANISGNDKKIDKMVVVVLKDDPAEDIKDTSDYVFGVQYALKKEDVKKAQEEISSKLKKELTVKEYNNLNEQAAGLLNGEVQAIIYNDAYTSMLEESYAGFGDKTKVVYTYELVSKLDIQSSNKINSELLKKPFTVYLSGIDVDGSIETTGRSDVNVLAVVNPNTHQVLLVTTPRDYYIELPGISMGMCDKLTHAGIYGVDASMAALSELYDVPVDFYARVNFTSLPKIVDALGGIDVYSESEFESTPGAAIKLYAKEGINHLNGIQALTFARERENLPGGDYQRGRNHEAVITAMIKKAISPAILVGASEIIDSVSEGVDTNMSMEQIQGLIKNQIAHPVAWKIKSMAATGTDSEEDVFSMPGVYPFVCIPDIDSVEEIKDTINRVIDGEKLEDVETVK